MAANKDWLKRGHIQLHDQIETTWNYIDPTKSTRLADFGYASNSGVQVWILSTFLPSYTEYDADYKAWKNVSERTQAKQVKLVDAESEIRKLYRQLYALFRGNPLVHDDDLVHMDMPMRPSGEHKPAPVPTTLVDCEVELSGPGVIVLHWFNKGSSRGKAKPYGMHGVEIRIAILDRPPLDWSELTDSRFDTRSPFKLIFSGEDRGKVLYFALRWENTTGVKGDWSEIYSVRIP
jgi:hypothetical protein